MNGKGRSGSDMRLQRVPYDEGDAPAFCAGPPAERGEERTEYPGGARSSILASSPAGRSQVSVSSMVLMSFFVVLNEGAYVRHPSGNVSRTSSWKCFYVCFYSAFFQFFKALFLPSCFIVDYIYKAFISF